MVLARNTQKSEPERPGSMLMTRETFLHLISQGTPERYEWIDGVVYNMTGSSGAHAFLALAMYNLLRSTYPLDGPCQPFTEQWVELPDGSLLAPDAVLTCTLSDWSEPDGASTPMHITHPRLVVEVLSKRTQGYDRKRKLERYKACATLEAYLLIHQKEPRVDVFRRHDGWQEKRMTGLEAVIQLPELGLVVPLATLYANVPRRLRGPGFEPPQDHAEAR